MPIPCLLTGPILRSCLATPPAARARYLRPTSLLGSHLCPLCYPLQLTLYLRLLAEYPATKTATGVEIVVPLPRTVQRVHCETGEWADWSGGRVGGWVDGAAGFDGGAATGRDCGCQHPDAAYSIVAGSVAACC